MRRITVSETQKQFGVLVEAGEAFEVERDGLLVATVQPQLRPVPATGSKQRGWTPERLAELRAWKLKTFGPKGGYTAPQVQDMIEHARAPRNLSGTVESSAPTPEMDRAGGSAAL